MIRFTRIKTLYNGIVSEVVFSYFKYRLNNHMPRLISSLLEAKLIMYFVPNLFDSQFYCNVNPDVADSGRDPLAHYVRYGSSEGRLPHPLVDEGHYRQLAGLGARAPISALGHYLVQGRSQGLSLAPWFDADFYRRSNPGADVARMDPFDHFTRIGAAKGYAPGPDLDVWNQFSLDARANFEISNERLDSFCAALCPEQEGNQFASLVNKPYQNRTAEVDKTLAALLDLVAEPAPEAPAVDVIVPVYQGYLETLTCLLRLLSAKNTTTFEVVVIDDASPEPRLSQTLSDLAERNLITLLRNQTNRGFVSSINRGMSLHQERDLIWLNSDTEVFGNWIDRLRRAAYSDTTIATVTPFTNNGTVCSYPSFFTNNIAPLEIAWPELDAMARDTNPNLVIELPTAVGFATYVKRAAIDDIGRLDEDAFGLGYGEENDFCQRGRERGWRDVLAADVFVRHLGATSFRESRSDRVAAAGKILRRRYPEYHSTVISFVKRDPVGSARKAIDRARLLRLKGSHNILIISHSRGGGTQKHVSQEIRRLQREGASVYILTSDQPRSGLASLRHVDCSACPSFEAMDIEKHRAELLTLLREIGIREFHVHHLIDFNILAPSFFASLSQELEASIYFTLHDYFPICPRINLVNGSGIYCGEPGEDGCRTCLMTRRSNYGAPDITQWRNRHLQLMSSARSIKVPSRDARDRLLKYFPDLQKVELCPHDLVTPAPLVISRPATTDCLRIGTIGAISSIKGFNVLLACADHARKNGTNVQFIIVGYTENDHEAARRGIIVTGAYSDEVVQDHVSEARLDMIFLPSIWPETYSYTLSIALETGLPIAAFDIGAIAERLRGAEHAILLPLESAGRPENVISSLLGGFDALSRNTTDRR